MQTSNHEFASAAEHPAQDEHIQGDSDVDVEGEDDS
jgi:hypothetical protein